MCLNNPKGPFIAEEDVVCYKRLSRKLSFSELNNIIKEKNTPIKAEAIINGIFVSGAIVKNNNYFYFLQNNYRGSSPDNYVIPEEYDFSWLIDRCISKIIIDNKELKCDYITPYYSMIIEFGILYESEIEFEGNDVEKALHSFVNLNECCFEKENNEIIVKCIIPKGSTYYIGEWNSHHSYASNQLKYLEIIE